MVHTVLENIGSFLYNRITLNPTIKRIIITFPFDISFITFFLDYFFYPIFLLISLLQFFSIKCSNNFLTIEIINNICPRNCIFNFFNYKNFFRPIWCVSFSKNIFVFGNSYILNLGSSSLTSFLKSI